MNDLSTRPLQTALPCLLLLLLSSMTALPTWAQVTRYVSTTGTNTNPASATSWATSTTNLQGVIDASSTNDQVWVTTGTYKPGGNGHFNRDLSFSMKNGVGIFGGFIGSETALNQRPAITISTPSGTTLSGDVGIQDNPTDNSFHLFNNPSGLTNTAILNGFLITGGNANGASPETYGGGMYNKAAGAGQICSPQLINCVFQNNTGTEGGAMYNNANGGGISSPILIGCTFRNNTATSFAGAILSDGGSTGTSSLTCINCLFLNNTAPTGLGGALFNYGSAGNSTPVLINCSFLANEASQGGAMFNEGSGGNSSPLLTNCSFQNNSATTGGALYNNGSFDSNSSPLLIQKRQADGSASKTDKGTSLPQLTNCVFFGNGAGNTITNNASTGPSARYSLFDPAVTGYTSVTGNLTTVISPFASTTSSQLAICSSAVNAGDPATTSATVGSTDLGGNSRFYAHTGAPVARIDIGAYELQTSPTVAITSQPAASSAACVGSTVTIVASVSGTAIGYQWYKTVSGGSATAVAGATSATLTLANVQTANAGSYSVVITGNCNSVTSTAFNLTINPLAVITAQPAASSVVCPGSTVRVFVSANGSVSTYQWYQNGTLVSGQTSATLTRSNVQSANAGSYSVVITGVCNSLTSTAFMLSVNPTPARLYVRASVTANANQTGLTWEDAFPDFQQALTYSCRTNLAEIWVANGLYKPTSTTARTVSFAMLPNVAIYGGFLGTETALSQRPPVNLTVPGSGPGGASQPSSTTLSGEIGDPTSTTDNSYHVIKNPGGLTTTAVLDGFVIRGGNANSSSPDNAGGGIYNNGISPTIRNCFFQSNSAVTGGAIVNYGNSPAITTCFFQSNSADRGGAISNISSSPVLTNCSFQKNSAIGQGGVLFNQDSDAIVTNCLFQNNASPTGGALNNFNSSLVLTNCSFQSNTAVTTGGALYNQSQSNVTLTNCSFQGNLSAQGGALYNNNSNPVLTNCVVYSNGGNKTFVNSTTSSSVSASYSLFDPASVTVAGVNISGPGNLTTIVSPFASTTSTQLASGSPAINAGDPATTSAIVGTTDLDGNVRFVNTLIDMGAYEFQGILEVFTLKDGLWNDASVWSVSRLPLGNERVRLKHIVTIPVSFLAISGTLIYDPASKLIYDTGGRLQLGQ